MSSEKKYWNVTGTQTTTYETVIEADSWREAYDLAGDIPWDEWDVLDDKIEHEVSTTPIGEPA